MYTYVYMYRMDTRILKYTQYVCMYIILLINLNSIQAAQFYWYPRVTCYCCCAVFFVPSNNFIISMNQLTFTYFPLPTHSVWLQVFVWGKGMCFGFVLFVCVYVCVCVCVCVCVWSNGWTNEMQSTATRLLRMKWVSCLT